MDTVSIAARVSPCHVIGPSDRSVSKHLPSSRDASGVSCPGLTGPRRRGRPFGAVRPWASPMTGRLATTVGRIEFTRVTDRSFTSGCSPPRLAATQLPSVTGCQNTPAGTCTPLIRCTYGRTGRPSGAKRRHHPATHLEPSSNGPFSDGSGATEFHPDRRRVGEFI